jgi:hypothetical protein
MLAFTVCNAQTESRPLYQNSKFALYPDRVVQQNFEGKTLSATELQSNYKSPPNDFLSPLIVFKFSINGKDNEMKSGSYHRFNCMGNGPCEIPLIEFGQQYTDSRTVPDNTYLKPQTPLKVKVDMREVIDSMNKIGYYSAVNGDKIYKQDFKGVYIAGRPVPLMRDYDNLVNHTELQLKDSDGDGIYETTITLNNTNDEKQIASTWKLSKDISAFPQYNSDYSLSNALYNMALEEMIKAVEPDSTFRTGKEWAGVWTRDISYSIILSMAYLQPQVAKYSLLRKVNKRKRIIQDTGTVGAWPCSTDRMIWAVAAWELYKTTGDENWLQEAYEIIKNSLEDDYKVAYDHITGLVKGESSFLDWREQTYPKWMQPVDIYESECLGTNAVHFQANTVLYNIAKLLGKEQEAQKYKGVAQKIKNGINKYLWMPDKGYYGQYLYGRISKTLSPRSEALGEALTILFGIADAGKQKQIISKMPIMDFGVPCIYPQIPGILPYHNNAVWPFVQSYWAIAAAKEGSERAVLESIAAIYRPAALWLTNKENFVASNGDFAGTQINSSNMLWSLSGNLALIHKVIFGIEFTENELRFHPFVPEAFKGRHKLTNFTYHNAVLDIELEGYGNQIGSFTLDGKPYGTAIPKNLKGRHTVRVKLAGNTASNYNIHTVEHYVSLPAPSVNYSSKMLTWNAINGAVRYQVLKNGKAFAKTTKPQLPVADENYAEYQVIAVDAKAMQSFASEPLLVASDNLVSKYEIENSTSKSSLVYKGFSGSGFVEISKTENPTLSIPITIPADGVYALDFRYANGNGPVNTENKCAIRTLKEGSRFLGTLVLPQRGKEDWSNWGWSNSLQVYLKKGIHQFTVSLEDWNNNMNDEVNQAMLDYVRLIKIN